jgi:pyruvate-formate lyase-activating enzyme
MTTAAFVDAWRRRACRAYDLEANSTARRTVAFDLWGRPVRAYANANLSVYSARACNMRCPFCVEQLRPAARGLDLADQRTVEADDRRYFDALAETLRALRPLDPSVSVTGGEPTKDPRLPRILRMLRDAGARKRTLTTNGSGLFDRAEGREVLDWILDAGVRHLNLSRAHPDPARNREIMAPPEDAPVERIPEIARRAKAAGCRLRLSCVLLRGAVDSLEGMHRYLDFAAATGVDNVVFRQLMLADGCACGPHPVARYSETHRVRLAPLLDRVSADARFTFVKQVLGYYYYVEVWRRGGIDVVFEEADLGRLEETKRLWPGLLHELVFHPDARLASTWQPWDGVLGPPATDDGTKHGVSEITEASRRESFLISSVPSP